MGASEWVYFVPYQPDIERALQDLRTQVFPDELEARAYPNWQDMTLEQFLPPEPDLTDEERAEYAAELARLQALPKPTTIEELLAWSEPDGTSSILDIEHVSAAPAFGTVSPLSNSELMQIFGTAQPSRTQVEQAITANRLFLREIWQGIYIVLYRDGSPDELCFTGVSGD